MTAGLRKSNKKNRGVVDHSPEVLSDHLSDEDEENVADYEEENVSGKKGKNKKNNNKKPKELTAEQKRKIEVIRKKNILLNIYEKHPFMYIKSHPDHSNRDKRHNLWVLITKEIREKSG